MISGSRSRSPQSTEATWPADGLERVDSCPVCGSRSRTVLYEGLRDRVFFCAPGSWTLYRCVDCGSGYLDPRPTCEAVGLAYRSYFTHRTEADERKGRWQPFYRLFANGYRNWRYGTNEVPSSVLGVVVKALQPGRRRQIDAEMRCLPRPWPGAALLDVGCGNGQFVRWAADMGWNAVGLDTDPKAAAAARSRGVEVLVGDIRLLAGSERQFDVITMSHVIEHVHDPVRLLLDCFHLLRPGGWVWVDTPNLDSLGHATYGSDWRGLEPPRHLVLFTHASLRLALRTAGFEEITDVPHRRLCRGLFEASEAIARGGDPGPGAGSSRSLRRRAAAADRREASEPAIREFVTVRAVRPACR